MNRKRCGKCNQLQPLSNFNFKHKKLKKYQSKCKVCQSEYHSTWYAKNKQSCMDRARNNSAEYIDRNKDFVDKYKRKLGCKYCSESAPPALDFHHIKESSKKRNISDLIRDAVSIKTLLEEIKKCDVVCANCHRKLHAGYHEYELK